MESLQEIAATNTNKNCLFVAELSFPQHGEVLGDKRAMYIMVRVLDCIVTVSFGVCLVLRLF